MRRGGRADLFLCLTTESRRPRSSGAEFNPITDQAPTTRRLRRRPARWWRGHPTGTGAWDVRKQRPSEGGVCGRNLM